MLILQVHLRLGMSRPQDGLRGCAGCHWPFPMWLPQMKEGQGTGFQVPAQKWLYHPNTDTLLPVDTAGLGTRWVRRGSGRLCVGVGADVQEGLRGERGMRGSPPNTGIEDSENPELLLALPWLPVPHHQHPHQD